MGQHRHTRRYLSRSRKRKIESKKTYRNKSRDFLTVDSRVVPTGHHLVPIFSVRLVALRKTKLALNENIISFLLQKKKTKPNKN